MILKGNQGEHWGGMDRYAVRAKGARMLASNFGGDTVAERTREAASLRSSRPNLKKVVSQIVIAHDKALAGLSYEEWLIAIEIVKEEHDLRDAAFCAVWHPDNHVHLYYMRIRPDGSAVSDSNNYRKNEAAARRIERELGLPSPTPVPREKKVGDRRASDNATRRGRRKQQTEREPFMETTELRRLAFEAVSLSSTTAAFESELAARGIEIEWSANQSGIKLRPAGASTWLKGSTVSRELSGAKIVVALQRNADLRLAAENVSAATIAVAGDRARLQADAHMGRNAALNDITVPTSGMSRALPPLEADAARTQAAVDPHPVTFLSSAEAAPPAPDDVPFAAEAPPAPVDADDEHSVQRRKRAVADEDLASELKGMSAKQLVELRNAVRRPLDEAIITVAILEKLLALALRILSFGTWKKSTPMADLLAQRGVLADAAEAEICRRHRTPKTATERMRALREHHDAINSRAIALAARTTAATLAKLSPQANDASSDLHMRVTEAFNDAQLANGKPTTSDLKNQIRAHDAAIAKLNAQIPNAVARLRRSQAFVDWEKRMKRAKELRAMTAEHLELLIDSIQRVVAQREAANATKMAQANAVLAAEAEGLAIEIRDRVPAVRLEIERDAQRERLRQAGRDSDDSASRMRG